MVAALARFLSHVLIHDKIVSNLKLPSVLQIIINRYFDKRRNLDERQHLLEPKKSSRARNTIL